jgi:hypothetical protein
MPTQHGLFMPERAIERRAFQSEAMGLCLGAACKLSFVERTREKKASAQPSINKALKLFALCLSLPGSPLDRHTVIGSPLTANNPGQLSPTGDTK